jgi:hypothetical protein
MGLSLAGPSSWRYTGTIFDSTQAFFAEPPRASSALIAGGLQPTKKDLSAFGTFLIMRPRSALNVASLLSTCSSSPGVMSW